MCCSEVLVKYIKRCKLTGERSESSSVRHKDFVRSQCLADEGRILLGSPATSFPCSHASWRLDCTYSSVLNDLSKNASGVCRGMCKAGNCMLAGKRRCGTPIRQPLPASMTVCCVQCVESIPCNPSGGVYEYT